MLSATEILSYKLRGAALWRKVHKTCPRFCSWVHEGIVGASLLPVLQPRAWLSHIPLMAVTSHRKSFCNHAIRVCEFL